MSFVLAPALALAACGDAPPEAGQAEAPPAAEAPPLLPPASGPNAWVIDRSASRLTFAGRQGDTPFTGRFERFDAQITLDPEAPEDGEIVVAVDLASVDAGSEDRNASLPERGWFDTARHKQARFVSESVHRTGEGAYEAEGTVSLKGVDRPLTLPFTLEVTGNRAIAQGEAVLDRSAFGVGQGDFAGPEWVALEVTVSFRLEATRADD